MQGAIAAHALVAAPWRRPFFAAKDAKDVKGPLTLGLARQRLVQGKCGVISW